ncbi:uncharacterized protein LOC130647519 [Hydractinia symbiolongicarpus]|uniref:uncharacterized protein LOC130647519 n=1 Tax=Hydractinia symbiolongicarpus TaxID=13093 RepID=UPI00254F14F1|nr:uncharacterized protein LOC130647519 [Hydractinia symbiolongicarpus]
MSSALIYFFLLLSRTIMDIVYIFVVVVVLQSSVLCKQKSSTTGAKPKVTFLQSAKCRKRIRGSNGTLKLPCKCCFGHGINSNADPLCKYGCGRFKVYPSSAKIAGFDANIPTNKNMEGVDKHRCAKSAISLNTGIIILVVSLLILFVCILINCKPKSVKHNESDINSRHLKALVSYI